MEQTYLSQINSLISENNLSAGPNFYSYYEPYYSTLYADTLHPNSAGYVEMGELWSLPIMSPQNVQISQNTGTVTLNWNNLSAYNSQLNGYKIEYGTSSGNYTTTTDVGNVTTDNITGLASGQTYYFTVSGYYSDSTSSTVNQTANSLEKSITATSTDATLNNVIIDGTALAGFVPTTFSYDEILAAGRTAIPVVGATTNNSGASAVITQAVTLPGSAQILVTAPDGLTTQTYTINFSLAAVVSSGGGGGGGGSGGSSYISVITETSTGIITATPSNGGQTEFSRDGEEVQLNIPAGAVLNNTLFYILPALAGTFENPGSQTGLVKIGNMVYQISAFDNGLPITSFLQPLTITFSYTDNDISGTNKNSLNVYWWSPDLGKWVITPSNNDILNNKITFSVNHLTVFALMAYTPPPAPIVQKLLNPPAINKPEPTAVKTNFTNENVVAPVANQTAPAPVVSAPEENPAQATNLQAVKKNTLFAVGLSGAVVNIFSLGMIKIWLSFILFVLILIIVLFIIIYLTKKLLRKR